MHVWKISGAYCRDFIRVIFYRLSSLEYLISTLRWTFSSLGIQQILWHPLCSLLSVAVLPRLSSELISKSYKWNSPSAKYGWF